MRAGVDPEAVGAKVSAPPRVRVGANRIKSKVGFLFFECMCQEH